MKLTTKEIVFLFCMFVAGCVCAVVINTDTGTKYKTPVEFLDQKPVEPPKVELKQQTNTISSIDNDPRLETIEISYTVGGNIVTEKEHKCAGCHWKCCQ